NAVNAGSATVRLNAATTVTQTVGGAGAVTGGGLAVVAAGNVDLCEVANSVATFAARDTAPGAFVRFLDTPSFTVGSVAADVCAAGATGVTTTINLVAPFTNHIVLACPTRRSSDPNAVNAGSATVRLNAATTVTQTVGGAGAVTGGGLAVV